MDRMHWVRGRETGYEVSGRHHTRFLSIHLHAHDHRIQIQHWLPVFSQNIQAYVSFQVDVWMIDLLRAFDLGRIVRVVLVDRKVEYEAAALVHAFIRLDRELEVKDIIRIRKCCLHRRTQRDLAQIW